MVLRGPLLGSSKRVTLTTLSLSLKVTDSFSGDGAAQRVSAAQTLEELQELSTHLRELPPAEAENQVIRQAVR